MCHILLQQYACGHQKAICITPCPHALAASNTRHHRSKSESTLSPQSPNSRTIYILDQHLSPPNPPKWLTDLPSYDPRIQYCRGYWPEDLPQSNRPCINCYMRPEFAAHRQAWVRAYMGSHPGVRKEEAEELSGVSQIPERAGLVNIVKEMDRMMSRRDGKENASEREGTKAE